MIRRKREGRPSAWSSARRAASLPGAFERLEARFAMDGGGMFQAIPLAPLLPVGGAGDHLAPAGPSSPMPSPSAFSGPSATLEDADAASPQKSNVGTVPPAPADGNQSSAKTAEETAPDTAGGRPVAPVIPKGWDYTQPPFPGWQWSGKDPPGGANGAWVPPKGSPRESLHKDTTPHDIGDHIDWMDIYGNKWKLVEGTGKWHPDKKNINNRPQPIFPEGTLVPPKSGPSQIPGNDPGGTTAPTQPIPFFPFWPWPAIPAVPKPVPTPSPFPVPAFGLPVLIIPIWPKPDTLRDYAGPPLA